MSNIAQVSALAALLRNAELTRQVIEPVRGKIGLDDLETAYAVQQVNVDARVAAGGRIVGRKIGLTSLVVQKQLGVDQPDFGTLFADMSYGDNQAIPLTNLIQPKIEVEIALVLKQDLIQERHTYVDIINATAYALAAIEIVDCRMRDWDIKFVDTVADNASSAAFVVGSRPVALASLDLFNAGMTLECEGAILARGSGAACLGNPVNAAVWLADNMVRLGTPLHAGDLLLTGALGPMIAITKPGSYTANIDGLGSVHANFV